jgi:SAM-dependent methyltransferase
MKNFIKNIIKHNLYLTICLYIAYNFILHIKFRLTYNKTTSGATHHCFSLKDSLQYITDVFADYQTVSGKITFEGKIAELGPGDSNGVALMFLAHGATQVDLADRFYSIRDPAQQEAIKNTLFEQYPQLIDLEQCCIRYYGENARGEYFFDQHHAYDCIISRSVLEHVDHPALVITKMFNALNPGGILIHKIDLRDHGMFTPQNHALKFLEIPNRAYQWMTQGSGYPNRFLFHRYQALLETLDPKVQFYIAGIHGTTFNAIHPKTAIPEALITAGRKFVDQHRARFAQEFEQVASVDLMISSFFFVCHK